MKKSPTNKSVAKETKSELETLLALHNKDMKRYVGALSEDFQNKLDAVIEQFGDIHRKLDAHSTILNTHTVILDKHTAQLEAHTEMIGQLMIDNQEIKEILKQKPDRDEFAKLEKRVVVLETMM